MACFTSAARNEPKWISTFVFYYDICRKGLSTLCQHHPKKEVMDRLLTGTLDEYGFAFLTVVIKNGTRNLEAKAIIDTGAAHCAIKKEFVDQLGLQAVSASTYSHVQFGEMRFGDYLVDILLDAANPAGGILIQSVKVTEFHNTDYPSDVLIGVDLLKHARFEYNGLARNFTMTISF